MSYLNYSCRESEGEVNGEGVVHATYYTYDGLMTECGREVTNLFFTVQASSVVSCLTCLVKETSKGR